jgi:GNAT superfamily N-acetyltransferase
LETAGPNRAIARTIEANLEAFLPAFCRLPWSRHHAGADASWYATPGHSAVFNAVYRARLPSRAAAGIDEVLREFGEDELTWWTGPSTTPANLGGRLRRRGFLLAEDWVGMALDLRRLPPATRADVPVEPVEDPAGLEQWARVFAEGFGVGADVRDLLLEHTLPLALGVNPPLRLFLAREGGETLAGGLLFPAASAAGLYCISTRAPARRRGCATAVTRALLEDARRSGYPRAVLQSTSMAEGLYRRLGFREYCRFRVYSGVAHPTE